MKTSLPFPPNAIQAGLNLWHWAFCSRVRYYYPTGKTGCQIYPGGSQISGSDSCRMGGHILDLIASYGPAGNRA